jgi:hypothetical protein
MDYPYLCYWSNSVKIVLCWDVQGTCYILDNQRDAVLSSLYLFYCQVTLHVSGVFRPHHQEYMKCSYNHWYKSYCKLQRYHVKENSLLHDSFVIYSMTCTSGCSYSLCTPDDENSLLHDTFVIYGMTCTSGCNYSLWTPDDGCGRHPKHVEWLGSKINKDCLELHLVGCLKHKIMMHGNMNIKYKGHGLPRQNCTGLSLSRLCLSSLTVRRPPVCTELNVNQRAAYPRSVADVTAVVRRNGNINSTSCAFVRCTDPTRRVVVNFLTSQRFSNTWVSLEQQVHFWRGTERA